MHPRRYGGPNRWFYFCFILVSTILVFHGLISLLWFTFDIIGYSVYFFFSTFCFILKFHFLFFILILLVLFLPTNTPLHFSVVKMHIFFFIWVYFCLACWILFQYTVKIFNILWYFLFFHKLKEVQELF